MRFYGGHDWGCTVHQLCIVDETGNELLNKKFPDSREGLLRLAEVLRDFGSRGDLGVCIEAIRGRIPELYATEGIPLYPVSANALVAERNRYGTSRSKSDKKDARQLANLLRSDFTRLKPFRPDSVETEIVRSLKDERDALLTDQVRKRNQLGSLLRQVFPAFLGLFAELDSKISRQFLRAFPSWRKAEGLTAKALGAWLKDHRYTGRQAPEKLLAALETGAEGLKAQDLLAVLEGRVLRMVDSLEAIAEQIRDVEKVLAKAVKEHPDAPIFKSFPMAANMITAGLISLFGDDRDRFSGAQGLAAIAGVAPTTVASGKSRRVHFRKACNKDARRTLTCFADLSRRKSDWARHHYKTSKARNARHPTASRTLARDWLRVIYACWKNRTPYDPTRHAAAVRLLERAETEAAA